MPRNGGPYLARNLALRAAGGSLIAIQDADDVSHPDRLARQAQSLAQAPLALATEAGHMRLDEDGRPQFLRDMRLVDDGTMSTMYRRTAFEKLGAFAETRVARRRRDARAHPARPSAPPRSSRRPAPSSSVSAPGGPTPAAPCEIRRAR